LIPFGFRFPHVGKNWQLRRLGGAGAIREEPRVTEQRKRRAGPGVDAGWTMPLPDLTDVDLRTLRAMEDPGLMVAVDQVFMGSQEFKEIWYSDEGNVRTFSAGLTASVKGEESQG
jgi:hypothetical protein